MRILFLGYWGFEDPLTTATVLPHLRLLQARVDVEAIQLVTIERGVSAMKPPVLKLPFAANKITFEPLLSVPGGNVLVNKTVDFLHFPRVLTAQAKAFKADFILARGAPAGSLAYLVWKKTGIPFYVESFEPHAEYMRQAGVWSRLDPRFLFQQYWENRQKRYARALLPVAENYRQQLLREGVAPDRVITVPCSVNLTDFAFDSRVRGQMRSRLGFASDALVGIYVGKFGGIYYDKEAFTLFRTTADFFGPSFRLLLLSPQPTAEILHKLSIVGIEPAQVKVVFAPFAEVPGYLSAADFGFGLHRPTPYVSPIKVGEYWASGLPVLLTAGVGDDSAIIEREGGGAVFNLEQPGSVPKALAILQELLQAPNCRANTYQMASRYRSIERAREAYAALF